MNNDTWLKNKLDRLDYRRLKELLQLKGHNSEGFVSYEIRAEGCNACCSTASLRGVKTIFLKKRNVEVKWITFSFGKYFRIYGLAKLLRKHRNRTREHSMCTFFAVFTSESRRAQTSISLVCKSWLANRVVEAWRVLSTGVLKQGSNIKKRLFVYRK